MFWFLVLYVVFYHRSGDPIGDRNGSSSGSVNFAASFAALSAYLLPSMLVCSLPWSISSISWVSVDNPQDSMLVSKAWLSEHETVSSYFWFTRIHFGASLIADLSSSYEQVYLPSFYIIVSMMTGSAAVPVVITAGTAVPPLHDPSV